MPLSATYSEETVRGLAPDEATFQRAHEIARAKKFQNLGVSTDGSWLLGDVQGSAKDAYHVSADFHDPSNPTLRSTSPSRKIPDKFSLALLLAYLQSPNDFAAREPSEDLIFRRDKKIALDEKKKSGSAAPRKVAKLSGDKKVSAQKEGLETVEKLLVDLVAAGHLFEPAHLEKVERHTKLISDAFLPSLTFGLRKLLLISKQKDLNDDEKAASAAEVIGQLWAMVQKARAYLDQKPLGDESQADADAVMEDLIGRPWQLAELREKGYYKTDLSLIELAFERTDDESRQQRIESSDLLDTNTGAVYQAFANRPFKGLNQIPEQTSFTQPLSVAEAAICPGFINRRIRWEKGTEQLIENPPANYLETAYAQAKTNFKEALDAFRKQLQNPLAPREALFFLRSDRIGTVGDRVVIQDASGTRIEMRDRRKDYSNSANLIRAAGMLGKDHPGILVRLYVLPLQYAIVGLPLAALTPKYHLRLGL